MSNISANQLKDQQILEVVNSEKVNPQLTEMFLHFCVFHSTENGYNKRITYFE